MNEPTTEIDTVAKTPSKSKASKAPHQEEVDADGFPVTYEDPEDEPESSNEGTAEKRKRQQKLLTSLLPPPQPEPAPAQIHVVPKAAPKPQPALKIVTAPEPQPETKPVAKAQPALTNKTEAVRQALAADPNLSGQSGVDYVKENFGLEMSSSMFSNYKSNLNKEAREAGTSPAPKATAPRTAAPKAAAAPAAGNVADLIRDVKALLAKHDANSVIAVVEALSE